MCFYLFNQQMLCVWAKACGKLQGHRGTSPEALGHTNYLALPSWDPKLVPPGSPEPTESLWQGQDLPVSLVDQELHSSQGWVRASPACTLRR